MTLEEFARQQGAASVTAATAPAPTPPGAYNPIAAAQAIIKDNKRRREIAEGCRLQILKDLEQGVNPYKLLLYAAEAISRLDTGTDNFFLEVQKKIINVYGADISEKDGI